MLLKRLPGLPTAGQTPASRETDTSHNATRTKTSAGSVVCPGPGDPKQPACAWGLKAANLPGAHDMGNFPQFGQTPAAPPSSAQALQVMQALLAGGPPDWRSGDFAQPSRPGRLSSSCCLATACSHPVSLTTHLNSTKGHLILSSCRTWQRQLCKELQQELQQINEQRQEVSCHHPLLNTCCLCCLHWVPWTCMCLIWCPLMPAHHQAAQQVQ